MLQTGSHIPQSRVITKTRNKFFEIVAVGERYLVINSCKIKGIKEAAAPTIPSRKISLRKNVHEKGKKFFGPNLRFSAYCQFEKDGWKSFQLSFKTCKYFGIKAFPEQDIKLFSF